MNQWIVCENIRSAYNVGNIIRTADALGRGVVISGYTPSPNTQPKVAKTSLGAENTVPIIDFGTMVRDIDAAYEWAREQNYLVIVAECLPDAVMLDGVADVFSHQDGSVLYAGVLYAGVAIWVGNEVTGVEQVSIDRADMALMIPMHGQKASLNVGQAAAIIMRACRA